LAERVGMRTRLSCKRVRRRNCSEQSKNREAQSIPLFTIHFSFLLFTQDIHLDVFLYYKNNMLF